MINKSFKFRIYPTKSQEEILARFFGASRYIYNHFLAEQKRRYAEGEKHLSHFDMNYEITKLKKINEFSWLNERDLYT